MTGHDEWAPDAPSSPGTVVVPGYSGLTEVARGGDSVVYRARQDNLARDVAIKVIDVTDPTAQARFARELAITVRLGRQHPHIVTVLDTTTTTDGRPCLVMEFHDLGSLHDRLRSHGPLPVSEVVAAGTAVADALAFAHAHGVLHRDVKPQNVLLLPTSFVLSDFGIARMADAGHTASLERFSYRHASPQVLDGAEPTAADDVWSLGSTLFTLLDGRAPFASDDPAEDSALAYLRRVRMNQRRPLRGDLPEELRTVVDACLTPDRDARTMSAADVLAALRRVPTEERSWAPPGSPVAGPAGGAGAAAGAAGAGAARADAGAAQTDAGAGAGAGDAGATGATDSSMLGAPATEPALPTAAGPVDPPQFREAAAGNPPPPAATAGDVAAPSPFAPEAQDGAASGASARSTPSASERFGNEPVLSSEAAVPSSASPAPSSASPAPSSASPAPSSAAARPAPEPAAAPAVAPSALAAIAAEPQLDAEHTSLRPSEPAEDEASATVEAEPERSSSSWTKVAAFIGGALVVGTGFGILSALIGDDDEAPAPAPSATGPVEVPTLSDPLPTVSGPVQASTGDPDLAPRNPAALDNGTSVLLTWADPVREVDYILVLDPGTADEPARVVHQLPGGAQEHTVEGVDPDAAEVCFVVAGYLIEDGKPTPGAGPPTCVTRG